MSTLQEYIDAKGVLTTHSQQGLYQIGNVIGFHFCDVEQGTWNTYVWCKIFLEVGADGQMKIIPDSATGSALSVKLPWSGE